MGCLSDEQKTSISDLCSSCLDNCKCTCESIKAPIYRLKWNWFFVIALSALVSNGASSPMGTLHEFVTNPRFSGAFGQQFEPGLGLSEDFYSWVISVNNIGGFIGGVGGVILTTFLPYWFSFMISVACHTVGFILYAVVTHGWMLIVGRLLVGIFTGLHRSLAFAYFAVTYEFYIKEKHESKKLCRVKDLLFAMYTVSTSIGYLIGAGVSVIFSRIDHIDHFRVIGWYNTALGFAFFVLLIFTFHGEFRMRGRNNSLSLRLNMRRKASQCCQKSNIKLILIVIFLITCTAVIKSRVTIYEELFNPILSDSFGFSVDNTVYFFLIILVAPILGGLFLLIVEWTRVNNIIIAVCGIIATIIALLTISDWQALLQDSCLEYSLYHNPNFGQTDTTTVPGQPHCWSHGGTTVEPKYHLVGLNHGHLELMLLPKDQRRLICDVYPFIVDCDLCTNSNSTLKAALSVTEHGKEVCLEDASRSNYSNHDDDNLMQLSIRCYAHGASNQSACNAVCLHLYGSIPLGNARLQDYDSYATDEKLYKSLVQDVYTQSFRLVGGDIYTEAMEACEAHTREQCHWIPNSLITKEHCGDCPPICRSKSRSLDFVQFSIGAFWFMFTVPVAEVSLPLIVSDSVMEKYQGLVMGVTVASSEFLQGVAPLWVNAAYEESGKRTFLPNIILIATFLPFLFGLCALYQTIIRLHRSIHPNI